MTTELREITYADAGVEALREEMRRDSTIVYIGQGIGPRGGNFRQTKGLCAEFGEDRLRDTGSWNLPRPVLRSAPPWRAAGPLWTTFFWTSRWKP